MNAIVSLARQFVVVRSMTVWHARVARDPLARLNLAEGVRDPYHLYEEVRRRGALVRSPLVGYQTASHHVCRQVLRDRRFGVRVEGGGLSRGDGQLSLLELDPPDHTRLRRLVAPAFTPHAIGKYRPRIEKVVDGLLDAASSDDGLAVDEDRHRRAGVDAAIQVILEHLADGLELLPARSLDVGHRSLPSATTYTAILLRGVLATPAEQFRGVRPLS